MSSRKKKALKSKKLSNTNCDVGGKLYPAMKNTKTGSIYGYINEKGKWIIAPRFTNAYDFNRDGLAIVTEKNVTGGINYKGEYVIDPIYESINPFKEERAVFVLNGNMGAMDRYGNVITRKKYNFVADFNEERAIVAMNDENGNYRYGFINKYGKEITPLKYISANDFKDDVALVKIKDNEFGLINRIGQVIKTYNYAYVAEYADGLMVFAKSLEGPYGYINKDGEVVIEAIYAEARGFNDMVAVVSKDGKYNGPYGVINLKGESIYASIYSDIKSLGEGILALGKSIGKYEFASRSIYAIGNTSGKKLTDFKYLVVGNYTCGLAYASDAEYTFFINKDGNINKSLPKVKGSGELSIKDNIVFADIDYSPYYLTKSGKIIYEPNKIIPLDKKYSVVREKYKPNINYLVYIPQVRGVTSRKVENDINSKLRDMSYFRDYGENSKDAPVIVTANDVLNYSYYGDFTVQYFNKNLLVLDMTGYYYALGAAHGLPTKQTPNIDLVTGKFYTLGDLFMGGVYWSGELNKIIENMIKIDSQYADLFKDGFTGIELDQGFYVDADNLYIYFAPYDIGPYAAGFITFKIPFSEMQGMINKNGDFYKSFN